MASVSELQVFCAHNHRQTGRELHTYAIFSDFEYGSIHRALACSDFDFLANLQFRDIRDWRITRLAFLFGCTRLASGLWASLWARLAVFRRGSAFATCSGFYRLDADGAERHRQIRRRLHVFGVLFGTLCLNARFGFFKLLASMIDMLLLKFTARIAVQIDALCANLDTVQITPA